MSYCRWSSDNWKCDLYCYESVHGGYYTHVAGNRIVGDVPEIDWRASPDDIAVAYKVQREFMDNCKRRDIGLPHDCETFVDGDLESFKARLLMLREAGYSFSDLVLQEIDAEIAEAA